MPSGSRDRSIHYVAHRLAESIGNLPMDPLYAQLVRDGLDALDRYGAPISKRDPVKSLNEDGEELPATHARRPGASDIRGGLEHRGDVAQILRRIDEMRAQGVDRLWHKPVALAHRHFGDSCKHMREADVRRSPGDRSAACLAQRSVEPFSLDRHERSAAFRSTRGRSSPLSASSLSPRTARVAPRAGVAWPLIPCECALSRQCPA